LAGEGAEETNAKEEELRLNREKDTQQDRKKRNCSLFLLSVFLFFLVFLRILSLLFVLSLSVVFVLLSVSYTSYIHSIPFISYHIPIPIMYPVETGRCPRQFRSERQFFRVVGLGKPGEKMGYDGKLQWENHGLVPSLVNGKKWENDGLRMISNLI